MMAGAVFYFTGYLAPNRKTVQGLLSQWQYLLRFSAISSAAISVP